MKTIIKQMTKENEAELVEQAARIWREGGLVAFPTETVYGLGANGLDINAAQKIYTAKGRPSDNPLILHIAERSQLDALAKNVDERAERLMEAFWPGPLTLIFNKTKQVPYAVTGGLETIAVRMPSHEAAQKLLASVMLPIAAPSANRSGRPSPTRAEHVITDLDGAVDMIIDGGPVGIGLESTIVDLSGDIPTILRPGYITQEMLDEVIGTVSVDPGINETADGSIKPKAPGMKYRHYAPKAQMILVEGEPEAVCSYINARTKTDQAEGKLVGVLATEESKGSYNADVVLPAGRRDDADSVARNLYQILRAFDEECVDVIYSESFTLSGFGRAIMNRMKKAAGHHIIKV